MVDLKRGSIIFNHKQTEGLLKNGHIASRGKAYAEGNAHVTIWPTGSSQQQWDGTGYSSATDPTYDLAEALDDAADSVEEFEETIDWIETRMEELDEALSLYNAKLENAGTPAEKNAIIDEMIAVNEDIYDNAIAGAEYYTKHAEQYLVGMDEELVAAAKNGAIAITDFTDDVDEATVEAIENYREFSSKAADLTQQAVETIAEVRDLALQKIDNTEAHGDAKTNIEDSQTEKLQNAVDYDEERGLITDPAYYAAMMENSKKKQEYWTETRDQMQKDFDAAVESGKIKRGDTAWYEYLDKLYQADAAIDEAQIELEEYQNAINDLYWDNFDQLIDKIDYVSDETQGLIDIMSDADMFTTPKDAEYWGADDVQWTDEGLATLGLHAQEMERAETKARMYTRAINDLKREYAAGHYTEAEYQEKLHELTEGQYEAIEAAKKEKEAIVELNQERVDAIKEGIEKEIDAYDELIDKKKEALDAEQDLYNFQKDTRDKTKNIADLERQIAALSGDNSASAAAKRKQLEAELLEAKADLEDTYYDRSISQQKEALDTEAEDFRQQKEREMEIWDEYMSNVEQVVKDSLDVVRENADDIGNTLTEKTNEYSLTVSDAVLSPWREGMDAIDEYTTKFGDSISATTAQLDPYVQKWQEVRLAIKQANEEADKYYQSNSDPGPSVEEINQENKDYIGAVKQSEPEKKTEQTKTEQTKQPSSSSVDTSYIMEGSIVQVKPTATHFSSKSGSAKMASHVPGGTYTVMDVDGGHTLIGVNGVATGWVYNSDLTILDSAGKSGASGNTSSTNTAPALKTGSTVTISKTATHFGSKSGGGKMASFVPGGTYTVMQTSGDQVLIGKNGIATGWVNKKDIVGYAKGTAGYAKGTLGVDEDQWAWIDEIGEELVLHAGENGKLRYLTKGTSVIPHDLTEKLMNLAMNPQAMLDYNRPTTGLSKGVINNTMEIHVDASVGTLLHVEHIDGNNPDEVIKIVDKAWDKKMQGLNNAMRKFTR